MRTVSNDVSVWLYHLDADGANASTLLYGTMSAALALAAAQEDDVQDGLYLQTDSDVVRYLDFLDG